MSISNGAASNRLYSLDASASVVLAKSGDRSVRLQIDLANLTDHFNVINFAGLVLGHSPWSTSHHRDEAEGHVLAPAITAETLRSASRVAHLVRVFVIILEVEIVLVHGVEQSGSPSSTSTCRSRSVRADVSVSGSARRSVAAARYSVIVGSFWRSLLVSARARHADERRFRHGRANDLLALLRVALSRMR